MLSDSSLVSLVVRNAMVQNSIDCVPLNGAAFGGTFIFN